MEVSLVMRLYVNVSSDGYEIVMLLALFIFIIPLSLYVEVNSNNISIVLFDDLNILYLFLCLSWWKYIPSNLII